MPDYVADSLRHGGHSQPLRTIKGPDDILDLLKRRRLSTQKREHFLVMLLDARHQHIATRVVSIGSLNCSIVHPREVFKPAILASAASVVLVHNHPSGDPEPSEEDLIITKRLVDVGELVGIGVLDHIIVAGQGCCSFRARQLI
jgi:DNA repair protein RadC